MKKKKNTNNIINLEDTNEIKEIKNKIEKEEVKEIKKENKINNKKETKNKKVLEKEFIVKEETKKEDKIEEKHKEVNKSKKSKFNIFLLIIGLIALVVYSYLIFSNGTFDLTYIIKNSLFIVILLIIIILLFKINTKGCTFYILLLTIFLIINTVFTYTNGLIEKDIYVLDFINKDIGLVIDFTDKYNLELIELHEYSDTIEKNHIIMQEYGINTKVSDIKSLTVTISDGPNYDKEVIVSNLTGLSYDEVIEYIKENKLVNVEIEFVKSEVLKDTVINQVGSGTMKRNSKIIITFSSGLEENETVVDDLANMSLFEATSYLKRNGITYEIEYKFSDKIEKDYVISQDIKGEVTSHIKLVVSKGKEIKVPDLKKMSVKEISNFASINGLKVSFEEVYNKEIEMGKVIFVNKEVGDIISSDDTLVITISKGSMMVPKITTLSDFKLWANNNNVIYQEDYVFSDTVKAGEIIKVSPDVNTKITENDTIVITISKGKSVTIPNLVGLSKTNIIEKCNSLGLSCTFTYGSLTETTKRDISLKQSKPVGTIVSSGTNVLITLSSGIYEKVNVPSFYGKSKQEISNTCSSLGIKCNFTYNNTYSNEAYDTGLNQDKSGVLIKGSTVNITLSKGPAKTYTIIIDGSLLSLGNPEQTKKTLKSKLESACPGVNFNFSFKAVNSGIGYLNPSSDVKVGSNSLVQGKTYNVIINSN